MVILLHTSKTMRSAVQNSLNQRIPMFINEASELNNYLKTLSIKQLELMMGISNKLASQTHKLISLWTTDPEKQRLAIDSFLGDIYSGLKVISWDRSDYEFADKHLFILSGLYGVIKPLDGIYPYRLEMGYKINLNSYKNLYQYWGSKLANVIPDDEMIINLSSVEYSKCITKYIDETKFISPYFMTFSQAKKMPVFVTIHSKIARGAFANWLIKNKVNNLSELKTFDDLGYKYNSSLSSDDRPVYICNEFKGLGLSIRLK